MCTCPLCFHPLPPALLLVTCLHLPPGCAHVPPPHREHTQHAWLFHSPALDCCSGTCDILPPGEGDQLSAAAGAALPDQDTVGSASGGTGSPQYLREDEPAMVCPLGALPESPLPQRGLLHQYCTTTTHNVSIARKPIYALHRITRP